MNRLAAESSLYLRQHANNPVDWFPWGADALARAAAEDKPIFLSIGYSACHWCHVMEHESFEHAGTAAVMNEHFVCVKVDREERPDLDQIYMSAHQLLTREGGGWPLTVFLAPDLTPFYAGTYFPPQDRYGRPGFRRLLLAIADAWKTRREHLLEVGTQVTAALASADAGATPGEVSGEILTTAGRVLKRIFDPVDGGFGGAPKFPHPFDVTLLIRLAARFDDPELLRMATHTLEKMARGGMYDQAGGGFHRYSVDAVWLVPHFEKMLYDNALLPPAYAEAFARTGDEFFARIARETLDYVRAEMTGPGGGFYSAQDADTEGEEGKFFVWSAAELREVLGPLAEFAERVYGVSDDGNFESHNILFRARGDAEDAARMGLSAEEFRAKLDAVNRAIYARRETRVKPGRDEKYLTAWNGMMISAMAEVGATLGAMTYVGAAHWAADFVLANLRGPDGRLFRTCGDGHPAKLPGYLEDYACLADGLVTLYETTFETRWLTAAAELADAMILYFADPAGGFYFTAADHEKLITRTKDYHDGSTPSGNAMAVSALLRLAILTGNAAFRDAAERTLRVYRGRMAESPTAVGRMLIAFDFYTGPVREFAIVGPAGQEETLRAIAAVRKSGPNRVVAFHDPAAGEPPAGVPLLHGKPAVGGRVTVYVCQNFACAAPLVGADAVERALLPAAPAR